MPLNSQWKIGDKVIVTTALLKDARRFYGVVDPEIRAQIAEVTGTIYKIQDSAWFPIGVELDDKRLARATSGKWFCVENALRHAIKDRSYIVARLMNTG